MVDQPVGFEIGDRNLGVSKFDADHRDAGAAVIDRRWDRRFSRKLDNFRLIGGFTHQTTQILPADRAGFCIVYLWR